MAAMPPIALGPSYSRVPCDVHAHMFMLSPWPFYRQMAVPHMIHPYCRLLLRPLSLHESHTVHIAWISMQD